MSALVGLIVIPNKTTNRREKEEAPIFESSPGETISLNDMNIYIPKPPPSPYIP